MDMTVNSVVNLLPETKEQISTFVSKVEESALDGLESPLFLYKQAKNMEAIAKALLSSDKLKESALNEAEKYHKDERTNLYNSKIEVCEVGAKWDYSECNHPTYNRICEEIKDLDLKKKALEKYLQNIVSGEQYIDPTTGECVELNRATKTSTTGLKITLNK